jgi:hypothetical protein
MVFFIRRRHLLKRSDPRTDHAGKEQEHMEFAAIFCFSRKKNLNFKLLFSCRAGAALRARQV